MRLLAVSVLFVGLVGLAFAGVRPLNGLAQESTPMADMASMPAGSVGLTARVLARVEPATAPGQELQLVRVEVAPGATVAPTPTRAPSPSVWSPEPSTSASWKERRR
jgi:hypothetical protein